MLVSCYSYILTLSHTTGRWYNRTRTSDVSTSTVLVTSVPYITSTGTSTSTTRLPASKNVKSTGNVLQREWNVNAEIGRLQTLATVYCLLAALTLPAQRVPDYRVPVGCSSTTHHAVTTVVLVRSR
jgi:hypothetical protein